MVQRNFTDSETPFSWIQRCMDLLACELEMGLGALLSLKAATPDLSDAARFSRLAEPLPQLYRFWPETAIAELKNWVAWVRGRKIDGWVPCKSIAGIGLSRHPQLRTHCARLTQAGGPRNEGK
jgi:hypothetical protein